MFSSCSKFRSDVQCSNGSKILATPSKTNSKTDYIAQAVCYEDIDKKKVIIGANPYTEITYL